MLPIPLRSLSERPNLREWTARLLALCCCACRSANSAGGEPAPAAEPSATSARAGATISTPYYRVQASLPEECPPPEPALGTDATHRIGIELSLEPTSDVQVPADPYYARLVDAERNVYEATLGGCGAALAPTLPGPGQTARGWIVFDLPRRARPVTLLYAPELVGPPKTELAIELSR